MEGGKSQIELKEDDPLAVKSAFSIIYALMDGVVPSGQHLEKVEHLLTSTILSAWLVGLIIRYSFLRMFHQKHTFGNKQIHMSL